MSMPSVQSLKSLVVKIVTVLWPPSAFNVCCSFWRFSQWHLVLSLTCFLSLQNGLLLWSHTNARGAESLTSCQRCQRKASTLVVKDNEMVKKFVVKNCPRFISFISQDPANQNQELKLLLSISLTAQKMSSMTMPFCVLKNQALSKQNYVCYT